MGVSYFYYIPFGFSSTEFGGWTFARNKSFDMADKKLHMAAKGGFHDRSVV
jgi:hypothetical protein